MPMLSVLVVCFLRCVLRSGRWRSEYVVDLNANQVHGRILVNVHYYEQGNVSLHVLSDNVKLIPSRSN
jgi:capping protein alpha